MMSTSRFLAFSLALAASLAVAPPAQAAFYVAHDTGAGTNNGHLTLLYDHGDHFHRIGTFGTGVVGRVPEASAGGPLSLAPGTGVFAGRFVSATYDTPGDPTAEFSNLEMRSFSSLAGFPAGSPQSILFNSSGGRYQGPLSGISLALELVSISAGLNVGDLLGNRIIANVGDRFNLGDAGSFSPFTPTFFTNVGATAGPYSATFRLVDLNGVAGNSGDFRYEFQAQVQSVPEPASLAMAGLGLGAVGFVAARRRKTAPAPTA